MKTRTNKKEKERSVNVALLNTIKQRKELKSKNTILYKKVPRVHRLTNHKMERNMIHVYNTAGKDSPDIRKAIKDVIRKCDICQRTKKSQGTPRFSFPKACSFNKIISIDLKEIHGKYILWMICAFSRFARGVVLKSKDA